VDQIIIKIKYFAEKYGGKVGRKMTLEKEFCQLKPDNVDIQ